MKYDALGRPVFEIIEPEIIEIKTYDTGQEKRRQRRKENRKPKLKNKKIW